MGLSAWACSWVAVYPWVVPLPRVWTTTREPVSAKPASAWGFDSSPGGSGFAWAPRGSPCHPHTPRQRWQGRRAKRKKAALFGSGWIVARRAICSARRGGVNTEGGNPARSARSRERSSFRFFPCGQVKNRNPYRTRSRGRELQDVDRAVVGVTTEPECGFQDFEEELSCREDEKDGENGVSSLS